MNCKAKMELVAMLARRSTKQPFYLAEKAARIASAAATIARIQVMRCNGFESRYEEQVDRSEDAALKRISKALGDLGIKATLAINGDPRGYAVFIRFARENVATYSNSWDKERGYGIG